MRRVLLWGAGVSVALSLAAVVAAGLIGRSLLEPVGYDVDAPLRTFVVEPGAGLARVTRDLEAAGLIRSARATDWLARWRGVESKLHIGEFELSPTWPPDRILVHLTSGRTKTYQAVLPEGIRASEIARRLEAAQLASAEAFLLVVNDSEFASSLGVQGDSLEGYLFPETYSLPRDMTPEAVARVLVEQFLTVWREVEPLATAHGLDMREVVTLASIVEKETAAPEERPLIAAVFLNRLELGMRLETDPTVIYGIPGFDGNLRRRHLEDETNPYNTYKIHGLPPGPIASPGAEALRAVVSPAETDYLFFVSRNDGTHHFSKTYREHVNAVNRYQKRRSSR